MSLRVFAAAWPNVLLLWVGTLTLHCVSASMNRRLEATPAYLSYIAVADTILFSIYAAMTFRYCQMRLRADVTRFRWLVFFLVAFTLVAGLEITAMELCQSIVGQRYFNGALLVLAGIAGCQFFEWPPEKGNRREGPEVVFEREPMFNSSTRYNGTAPPSPNPPASIQFEYLNPTSAPKK